MVYADFNRFIKSLLDDLFGRSTNRSDLIKRNQFEARAFYIGEADARLFGGMIAPYVYRYVFEMLGFKKIIGEVMQGNENVRKMHIMQGSREIGIWKQHINKYNQFHDVYLFEMLDTDWDQVKSRYANCIADFED
jgi:UDP-4-amino-4,6-dideoxy-N-acetyl-beta-L-altrosamine N-acetyltransferase